MDKSVLDHIVHNIQRSIGKTFVALRSVVRPGRTTMPSDETKNISKLQVQSTKVDLRRVTYMQHYGFASSLDKDVDFMSVAVAGDPGNETVIASNNQKLRPKNLKLNEVQIYDDKKQSIYLQKLDSDNTAIVLTGAEQLNSSSTKSMTTKTVTFTFNIDKSMTINCDTAVVTAKTKITLDTPLVEITGNLRVDGSTTAGTATGGLDMINLQTHTHWAPDAQHLTGKPTPGT